MPLSQAASVLGSGLKLSAAESERLAGVRTATMLQYDLPVQRLGAGTAAQDPEPTEASPVVGTLRVRVMKAEGLPSRPDGEPCAPYVTVSVTELTRRRVKRTSATGARGPDASWDEAFEFEGTGSDAQVVVDVWDRSSVGGTPDLLGKVLITVGECRLGVPHTYLKHLIVRRRPPLAPHAPALMRAHPPAQEGKLSVRLLFDTAPLPAEADEAEAIRGMLGHASA